jgi:hypothetical protein
MYTPVTTMNIQREVRDALEQFKIREDLGSLSDAVQAMLEQQGYTFATPVTLEPAS